MIIFLSSLVLPFLFTHCSDKPSLGKSNSIRDNSSTTTEVFTHPGIINSAATLNRVENISIETETYLGLLSFIEENPIADSYPAQVIVVASGATPTEDHIRRDAILAYAYALKWVKTGAAEDARGAISILNGWATNFEVYLAERGTPTAQIQLEAAWVAPSFAAAAEIIRRYRQTTGAGAGWTANEIQAFSDFLVKLEDYIDPMITDIRQNGRRINNWGASAGYAKMALGVFLESEDSYKAGKDLILDLLPQIIKEDGEVLELCSRDCHHPQYSMSALTYAAEIAQVQGDVSIYQANNNRLGVGWEWMYAAFSGNVTCRNCSNSRIFPAVEIAANYYPSFDIRTLNESQRPHVLAGQGNTFLGFTTLSHFGDQ